MQKITTFLTYNNQVEEAANFYTSLFENSKIDNVMRAGDAVMGVSFQLAGQQFNALN
ncbi:MAG: VOC family protein, partial [Anaerolineales bacterium]